jgi:Divergent InlB B-repeat domain
MQRFIDHAVRPAGLSRGRFAALGVAGMLLVMVAFPSLASAATQTLTVKKVGTGTGTVTSAPAGFIECGATCSAPILEGTTIALSGSPGPNTAAVVWSGCDKVNLEDECLLTMSAPKTVTATFNLLERTLTLTKKGAGAGTVTSSPAGIECGATCSASFVKGSTVTLTGVPTGKTLAPSWSGCDNFDAEGKCVVTMSAARSVTVTFDLPAYQLTVKKVGAGAGTVSSSPTGISCGATCSAPFVEGSTVTLTGVPDANSTPVQWTGCTSVKEGKCLVTMNAARAVTATFDSLQQLTLTKVGTGTGKVTSSPAGIECGSSCSAGFVKGQIVTLTGTPGLHTKAVKWSGCDSVNAEGKCLVTMSAARTVIATFDLERQWLEYLVTVQRKGTGKGTVTSVPGGISCGADCSETYLYNTQLTLTAIPAEGSVFKEWSGGGCLGQSGPCTTTVNATRLIRAIFVAVGTRTLSVAKAGTGGGTVVGKAAGIDCGSICSVELDASTRVTLRATPAAGSTFSGWSGEGCIGTAACKVLMNEARNVTASFAKLPGPAPRTGTLFIGGSAKVKGGKAMLRVSCGGGACNGTLKLVAKIHNALGQVKGLVIAKVAYSLAAGASSALEAKLSARGLGLLRDQGRLKVRATGGGVEGRGLKLAR